jgi:hypothetical protein
MVAVTGARPDAAEKSITGWVCCAPRWFGCSGGSSVGLLDVAEHVVELGHLSVAVDAHLKPAFF